MAVEAPQNLLGEILTTRADRSKTIESWKTDTMPFIKTKMEQLKAGSTRRSRPRRRS